MAKSENKAVMSVWNEKLSVREKVDKAVKNIIKAEEELNALLEWAKQNNKKTVTKDNLDKLKDNDIYKVYRQEVYKKALAGFGISKAEAEVRTNSALDIFDEDDE